MWDWLGTLWDTVVDATSTVNWGDVATDSLTTSLAGAAVGALASAVSDGDVAEGLLYGAAGGLVSGGLMSFGDDFVSGWNWAANAGSSSIPEGISLSGVGDELDFDLPDGVDIEFGSGATIEASGMGDAVASTSSALTADQQVLAGLKAYGLGEESWMKTLAPVALQVGGGMLAGAFAPDPADAQKDLMEAQWKRDDQLGERATGALASVHTPRGASVVDKSAPVQEEFQEIQGAVTV